MFDKLVVSSLQRRSRRTVKFFVCTSITYLSVVAFAFALSIYLASPKLADSSLYVKIAGPPPPQPPLPPRISSTPSVENAPPDFRNPRTYDDLANQQPSPPRMDHIAGLPNTGQIDGSISGAPNGEPYGTGNTPGVIGSDGKSNDAPPPRPPDPPKPTPRAVETDNRPLRVSSTVLQGKVIERRVPSYPELVKRIRLQGDVAVEVIISPEGRVESVRAVSGHPMLTATALEAARHWRFEPTLLNGVPVRVTGVITFVFKLNE